MKKILIFYGSYGGGHLSAARSIKEYLEQNYNNTSVEMIDCIEYINKFLNKITIKAYQNMAKTAPWAWKRVYNGSDKGALSYISKGANRLMSLKLNKLIQEICPNLIISTHPFSSQMCAILKRKGLLSCKIATVMTDYEVHNQWLVGSKYMDYYFVAHSGMVKYMEELKIPKSKVFETGIPISNRFLQHYKRQEILKEFGLMEDKITVLFFAGGEFGLGKNTTHEILQSLIELFPNFQVVAISGRNVKMKEKFDEYVKKAKVSGSVKILGYTSKVPELMSVSDLVITKPGGLTITESLALNLPIVVINPIPGQEKANAEFLQKHNVAVWIKKEDNIKKVLVDLFNDPEKLKEMKVNAGLLAKRNSTIDICKILMEE